MQLRSIIIRFFASIALAGCVQFSEGGHISDPHTGVSGYHSGEFNMTAQTATFVSGQILYTDGVYGITADVTRPGTDPIRITEAFSFGREIVISAKGVDFSCATSGCTVREEFTLLLSSADISTGVNRGMEIKVVGNEGEFLMKVPKEAFSSLRAVMAQ